MGIISDRIISLASEVNLLESKVDELSSQLAAETNKVHTLTGDLESEREGSTRLRTLITHHEERIKFLESELAKAVAAKPIDPPPPPSIPKPPITSAVPDVKISFMGQTFSPTGPGELWPLSGELRWRWKVDKEVSLVLDAKGKQRRIFVERAGADLPLTAPPIESHMKVILDGEVFYDDMLRVHHHTRPCETFRRLEYPTGKSLELFSSNILPNFDFDYIPAMIELNGWQWKQWRDFHPDTNKWSEDFGVSIRDWSPGLPLSNEASPLPPWDLFLMKSLGEGEIGKRLYEICSNTWDSSGNYAIHFFDADGNIYKSDDKRLDSVPRINPDSLPRLKAKNGTNLPLGDLAHDFGLVLLPALVTNERYYIEELMAWILLGPLSGSGGGRESGTYFSGQVRASAWWLRSVYYLYHSLPSSVRNLKEQAKKQLIDTLTWMNKEFVDPSSPSHYKTGLCAYISPGRDSVWSKTSGNRSLTTLTGNHHFLAFILGETNRDPNFTDVCEPILRHVLKVTEGVWKFSPHKYVTPWLQHAAVSKADGWDKIMANTFAGGVPADGAFASPLDTQIVGWYRAAVVAGVDLGLPWALEALNWIDAALAKAGKKIPPAWAIRARGVK